MKQKALKKELNALKEAARPSRNRLADEEIATCRRRGLELVSETK